MRRPKAAALSTLRSCPTKEFSLLAPKGLKRSQSLCGTAFETEATNAIIGGDAGACARPRRKNIGSDHLLIAQTAALAALVKSMWPSSSILDLVVTLVDGKVLSRQEGKALSKDLIAGLVATVSAEGIDNGESKLGAAGAAGLVLRVIRLAAESTGMGFSDVLGQILWQNRRAKILQEPAYKVTVEDISWAAFEPSSQELFSQPVEDVFRACTTSSDGRMKEKQWRMVVHLVEKNPLLRPLIRHTEVDRLFFAATHASGQRQKGISCRGFKRLLLQLAESLVVHPAILLLAVASHANKVEYLAAESAADDDSETL